MKKLLQTATLCLGLAAAFVQTALAQERVEIGTQIYPKTSEAMIRVNNQVIGKAYDVALPLHVRKVNGDWLWIWVDEKKTEGWIHRNNVCTAREAVSYFTQQIAVNPNDDHNYFCRGSAYKELGQLDRALDDESQRIRLNPKSAWAYTGRGTVWRAKKELDIAISDHTEAIRLDPKFIWAYVNRGNAWSDKQNYDRAIADYAEAIRLDPRFAGAYNGRGLAKANKQNYDQAIADYSEAIRLDPKYALAYYGRGHANADKQNYDQAIADYTEAIRLDPKLAYVYNTIAWLRATCPDSRFRNGPKAVEYATKACELYGWKNDYVIDTLAAAFAEAGDFDKAVKYQQRAIELTSSDQKSELQSRLSLYRSGRPYRELPKGSVPTATTAAVAPAPAPAP